LLIFIVQVNKWKKQKKKESMIGASKQQSVEILLRFMIERKMYLLIKTHNSARRRWNFVAWLESNRSLSRRIWNKLSIRSIHRLSQFNDIELGKANGEYGFVR
jgi:hypothetical protein